MIVVGVVNPPPPPQIVASMNISNPAISLEKLFLFSYIALMLSPSCAPRPPSNEFLMTATERRGNRDKFLVHI